MPDYIEDTDSGIYRITSDGKIYTQSKLKIPLVGEGMEFTGNFKIILKKERELKTTVNNRGYYSVGIRRKTHMVHRLVAQAFIPNPLNKPFVNHIDGNKLNNTVSNLEWCTAAENNEHARLTGLHIQARGYTPVYKSESSKKNSWANLINKSQLTEDEVRYIRSVYIPRDKEFGTRALGRKFNISGVAISNVISRKAYPNIE
jgi:hypothetical protein